MAEVEGFEPSIGFPIHAFQACALGRYAKPPRSKYRQGECYRRTNYDSDQILRATCIALNSPRAGMQQG